MEVLLTKKLNLRIQDLLILGLTLESINVETPLGLLNLSFITVILLVIYISINNPKINMFFSTPLILFSVWFTFISTFQGSSILGNLSRCWFLSIFALLIPTLEINNYSIINSIRKVIYFHSFMLIIDYLFGLPIGWIGDTFVVSGNIENFSRASGLFAEPSYYGIVINCLFLILTIYGRVNFIDKIFIILSSFLTLSISSIICSLFILFLPYSIKIINFFKNKNFRFRIKKTDYIKLIVSFLLTPLIIIIISNSSLINRITNPLDDNSAVARTIGSFFYLKGILSDSPIYGYGLGGKQVPDFIEKEGNTFSLIEIGLPNLNATEERHNIGTYSLSNVFVLIVFLGGLVALILFIIYMLLGFGLNGYLLSYLLIGSSCGSLWFTLIFILPAISKRFKLKK